MIESPKPDLRGRIVELRGRIALQFSVVEGKADHEDIDSAIRDGAHFRGANAWMLVCAILVASVGLNINSTAVIIGAMLISPLMGPIMAIGYAVATYDFALIKQAFRSLAVAVVISVAASTLYFALSPLSGAQSELLARTTPTVWDVLIALFGGLAGIIGVTRREKTNVIPGVAIATALMPPLCTAGYGLATGHFAYFAGAFYLFCINSVFIAFATIVIVNVMHPPRHHFQDPWVEAKVKRFVYITVLATLLPSVYLAYRLVRDEAFRASAAAFVHSEFDLLHTHVLEQSIEPKDRIIEVSLIGEQVGPAQLANIRLRLKHFHIAEARLIVHQASDEHIDVRALKSSMLGDAALDRQRALERVELDFRALAEEFAQMKKAQTVQRDADLKRWTEERDTALALLQKERDVTRSAEQLQHDVSRELVAQYPRVKEVRIAVAGLPFPSAQAVTSRWVVELSVTSKLPRADIERIGAWMKVRGAVDEVELAQEVSPTSSDPADAAKSPGYRHRHGPGGPSLH
jgi:uncharacterized hydrophobic protein (TIGR00271 family)